MAPHNCHSERSEESRQANVGERRRCSQGGASLRPYALTRRRGESGQALIVAVLLMLVVAAVAGVFIAVVVLQLSRAARQSDVIRARQYAQAAVRYAQYNLLNSPEGAGWRPASSTSNFGSGNWQLTVSYRPAPGDPYSQFVKIEAVGRPSDNPLVPRRAVAYVPIGITDHVRWVTNHDGSPAITDLGVPLQVVSGQPAYRTDIVGPLRVNGDLQWHSRVHIALNTTDPTYLRADTVSIAGDITYAQDPNFPPSAAVSVDGGADQTIYPSADANFTALNGRYRDRRQTNDAAGSPRWVRRLDPPDLLRTRYLDLTRNTGYWRQDQSDGNRWYKTGYYVTPVEQGDGIYVDNSADIQFGNDYDALRDNLMGRTALYWDDPGKLNYDPPGAEVELHPTDDPGNPHGGLPYVRITRHDAGFYQPSPGAPTSLQPLSTVDVPYPRDGVIFLLGNAKVRGTLPPRAGSPGSQYYVDANNRYYHLTIVSMGHIYIESSLLSPLRAGLTANAAEDSKLALLARGSVVLNATRMGMRPVLHPYSMLNGCYEIQPGQPFEAWYTPAGTPPAGLKLLLWHAGADNPATTGPAGQAIMNLLINYPNAALPNSGRFDWSLGGAQTTTGDPDSYYLFRPPPTWTANNTTNAVAPEREALPASGAGYNKTITLDPYLVNRAGNPGAPEPGVSQRIRIETPFDTARNYWLYNMAVQGTDVEVDALIYAQTGSWFVLPGAWFNDDPNPLPAGTDPSFPGYHEPLDIKVTVNGAISEGRAAPLGDALDWVSKWRGSDENWDNATGTSSRGLNYNYDPSLRVALDPTDPASPPALPGLPVSPMLLAYGEHM